MGGYSVYLDVERFKVIKTYCYWPLLGYHVASFWWTNMQQM
jgi:hypothetical protein